MLIVFFNLNCKYIKKENCGEGNLKEAGQQLSN